MVTKTSIVPIDCRYQFTSTQDEQEPVTNQGGFYYVRSNTSNWTDKIPNYRKVISEGRNATTDFSFTGYEYEQTPSYFRMHAQKTSTGQDRRTYLKQGNIIDVDFPSSFVGGISTTEASNQALAAFYSHLASVDASFKGMVFAGEFRETLAMLRHPFRAFRRGIGDYLNYVGNVGRRLPKHKRPSFVRRTWLEYSYGLAPLISDCGNAIDTFYGSQIIHPIFEMVRGRGLRSMLVSDIAFTPAAVNGISLTGRRMGYAESEVKYYGIYHSTGSGLMSGRSWGFTASEFIPTIYELIPYSFLVDYFTNVGKIIESWSYRNIGARFISSTVVRKNRYDFNNIKSTYNKPLGTSYTYDYQSNPGDASITYRNIQRFRSVGYPLPSFDVKVPGKWYQWVNIAALSANHRSASRKLQS